MPTIFFLHRKATHDKIIRRMRFSCWITEATDAHSKYVKLIPFSNATLFTQTLLNYRAKSSNITVITYVGYSCIFHICFRHVVVTMGPRSRYLVETCVTGTGLSAKVCLNNKLWFVFVLSKVWGVFFLMLLRWQG